MTVTDQDRILRENRRICILMEQHINRCLAAEGITAIQAHLLLYILFHADRGTSLTDIHREFGYSMGTLSGMVKRLRSKGYVRVESCGQDERRKLLFPTERSMQIRSALDDTVRRVQQQLCDHFSQEELDTLLRLQAKMLENLSALRGRSEKEDTLS